MKKTISVVLLVLVMASLMLSCSGSSDSEAAVAEGKQTVRIGWLNMKDRDSIDPVTGVVTPGKEALEKLLSEKSGHNVEIISVANNGWIQTTETLIQSGEVDMARYSNQTQVPTWFTDLTPFIESDPDLGNGKMNKMYVDYAQHYIPYRSYEYPDSYGKIYGMPLSMTAESIGYDRVLFEQWGKELPDENTTLEDLLELGKEMTGINPVTGEHNYGLYLATPRTEFLAINFGALQSVSLDSMDINDFDTEKYVESLKDSPELLAYFEWIEEVVQYCPEGITTNAGGELWLSEDNNIAIHLSGTTGGTYTLFGQYYRAGVSEITDRFKWLSLPASAEGMQGFPELQFMGISQYTDEATQKACWDVLKVIATDIETLDYQLLNYEYSKVPVLKDPSELTFMTHNATAQERYEYQSEKGFITDDYWHFRSPVMPIVSQVMAKTISAEDARAKTYEEVKKWVNNKKSLSK